MNCAYIPTPRALLRRANLNFAGVLALAIGLTAAPRLSALVEFKGAFTDRPAKDQVINYTYSAGLVTAVNNVGNIPGWANTTPASSQGWRDPAGATLQGDARYANPLYNNGDFNLMLTYSLLPYHPLSVKAGTVHFTNGVADNAYVGSDTTGIPSNTGVSAVLILSGIDQGRIAMAGDPVQVPTGAAVLKRTLFELRGARDWSFDLNYNSLFAYAQDLGGAVGFGWNHRFETRLKDLGSSVQLLFNAYQSCSFVATGSSPNMYASTDDAARYDVLTKLGTGGWSLVHRDQSAQRFDSSGRLVEDTDAHGRILAVAYDGSGRIASIVEPISNTRLTFTYVFGTPRIDTITDSAGAVVRLSYGADQLLNRIVNQNGKQTSFAYNTRRMVTTVTDHTGAVVLANTYDAEGRVILQEDDTPDNEPMRFSYKEQGMPGSNLYAASDVAKRVPLPLAVPGRFRVDGFTNIDGQVIDYAYDAAGRLVSATVNGAVTTVQYDGQGRATSVTDPAGAVTPVTPQIVVNVTDRTGEISTYTFGPDLTLTSFINPLLETTRYGYDARLNLASISDPLNRVSTFEYDGFGNLTKTIDAVGRATVCAYDSRNNLLSISDPAGGATTWTYDSRNNRLTETNANGDTTSWTYDGNSAALTETGARGGIRRFTIVGGRVGRVEDPTGVAYSFHYDADGRVTSVLDGNGRHADLDYDLVGNPLHITDPLNQSTQFSYDHRNRRTSRLSASGALTQFEYQGGDRVNSVTDALGGRTMFGYDGEGRATRITDPSGRTARRDFDPAGRVRALLDPAGNRLEFEHDWAARLTAIVSPDGARSIVGYDGRSLPTSITDALDQRQLTEFGGLDLPVNTKDPLGLASHLTWDPVGRLRQCEDPSGLLVGQNFDSEGRLISVVDPRGSVTTFERDLAGRLSSIRTAEGRTTRASFDSLGQVASMVLPSGRQLTFERDAAGRLSTWSDETGAVSISRDECGRPIRITENGVSIERTYDKLGRLSRWSDSRGNLLTYAYDSADRLTELGYPDGKKVTYAYDAAGRMETVTDWSGRITRYLYDANSRVTSIVRPNGTTQLREYDAVGQLTRLTELARDGVTKIFSEECRYDADGRVISVNVVPAVEAAVTSALQTFDRDNRLLTHNGAAVSVDLDGRLLSVASGVTPALYRYDARGRLLEAGSVAYAYDAEGRRTRMTDARGSMELISGPLPERDCVLVRVAADGTTTRAVYGLGLLYEESDAQTRYFHCDRRGNAIALTDEEGNVTDRFSYGPYGEEGPHQGSSTTPFRFGAKWGVQTDANGLCFHRARYYHPALRRFLTEDSWHGEPRVPATLNRYAYTRGNPVGFVDPSGRYDEDVHRDLTFNLALRAGFSREEAMAIAEADQGVDDNEETGPFSGHAARRDFHFTTPERRAEMLQLANNGGDLALFGQFLHAEQDSFSHQHGQTDRDGDPYGPWFGHLFSGHGPDRTSERPELALKMSEDTYRQLQAFYERTHAKKSCDDWSHIRPFVADWVKLSR